MTSPYQPRDRFHTIVWKSSHGWRVTAAVNGLPTAPGTLHATWAEAIHAANTIIRGER